MMMRRWPNGLGFDLVDDDNDARLSVLSAFPDRLVVCSVEQDDSLCGEFHVRHFSLDRGRVELGLDLCPENLSGEALLDLVNAHGEACE